MPSSFLDFYRPEAFIFSLYRSIPYSFQLAFEYSQHYCISWAYLLPLTLQWQSPSFEYALITRMCNRKPEDRN